MMASLYQSASPLFSTFIACSAVAIINASLLRSAGMSIRFGPGFIDCRAECVCCEVATATLQSTGPRAEP